jgi:hypothetical protein
LDFGKNGKIIATDYYSNNEKILPSTQKYTINTPFPGFICYARMVSSWIEDNFPPGKAVCIRKRVQN